MKPRVRRQVDGYETSEEALIDAELALHYQNEKGGAALSAEEPMILAYYPVARSNPFQRLIYCEGWKNNIATVPLANITHLPRIGSVSRKALHLHWINDIFADCESRAEVQFRRDAYLKELDSFKASGWSLMWTIHNLYPHESRSIEDICDLYQEICDRCDAIHLLAPQTIDIAKKFFNVDASRSFIAEHPHYVDAYPNFVTKSEARYELKIPLNAQVFSIFGGISAYKQIEKAIDCVNHLNHHASVGNTYLLVGGPVVDVDYANELKSRVRNEDKVRLMFGRWPAEEMQYILKSADFTVLPYRQSLNSGAAMLSLSFGRPFIAPHLGEFARLANEYPGLGYTYANYTEGLMEGIEAAINATTDVEGGVEEERFERFIEDHNPVDLSNRFFEGTRRLLETNV